MLSFASDKAKLFAEIFSENFNLDDFGISLPIFPSRTSLKLHIVRYFKGPDCIPVVVIKN